MEYRLIKAFVRKFKNFLKVMFFTATNIDFAQMSYLCSKNQN